MAYADSIRTANYVSREQIADLIEDVFTSSYPVTWNSWSPTWGALSPMTFTVGTVHQAVYARSGDLIIYHVTTSGGTTGGSSGGAITMTLPITPFYNNADIVGYGWGDGTLTAETLVVRYVSGVAELRVYDSSGWRIGSNINVSVTGIYRAA